MGPSVLLSVTAVLLAAAPAAAQCQPHWSDEFPRAELAPAPRTFLVVGDGPGQTLYAGGPFAMPGPAPVRGVARWEGADWGALGDGLSLTDGGHTGVWCFAVFDDGSGPALYAGGQLNLAPPLTPPLYSSVARWNGQRWVPFPGSVYPVTQLAVFDDGGGPRLYAAMQTSQFYTCTLAVYSGSAWTPLGSPLSNPGPSAEIHALLPFDDGGGPALFAGGRFQKIGSVTVNHAAKWQGGQWRPLRDGFTPTGEVYSLHVHDDGAGPAMYAGGRFSAAAGAPADGIARWNGRDWLPVGEGRPAAVRTLATFNPGPGPLLIAGGDADGGVASWDGHTWSLLGDGADGPVSAVASFSEAGRPVLFAAGTFTHAGPIPADGMARWDGSDWTALTTGGFVGGGGILHTLDPGGGEALFARGLFSGIGAASVRFTATLTAGGWAPMSTVPVFVGDLAVADLGAGPQICAAGGVTPSSSSMAQVLQGGQWTPLGGNALDRRPERILWVPDGPLQGLYVAGDFTVGTLQGVARWEGPAWVPVGAGLNNDGSSFRVSSLLYFDDGSGPAIYAGGTFRFSGQQPVSSIARFRGGQWTPVGAGLAGTVNAAIILDDGSGPALHVAGSLAFPGSSIWQHLVKWDGQQWSAVGPGPGTQTDGAIYTLAGFDDGRGHALFAGGSFQSINGVPARNIARWDGHEWSPLAEGTIGAVGCLRPFDDGRGPALWVTGQFTHAGGLNSRNIARWIACPPPCYANCDGSAVPPILSIADFTCFLSKFAANDPYANCDASTAAPYLNISDFICFLNRYAAGCP